MDDLEILEKKFDSFLNKTIIMSSRNYFIKQMNIFAKENTIMDNEDFSSFLQGFIDVNSPFMSIDELESKIVLNSALNCLSELEQAVIFLLYDKELSQSATAEIVEVYSKTISKIKKRAIEKLRKYMEGNFEDEK